MVSIELIGQLNPVPMVYTVDFKDRPLCPSCNTLMNVHSYSDPSRKIGLNEVYYIRYRYYICENLNCPNYRKKKIHAPNPYNAPFHLFDYEVEARVCELHFKGLKNLDEIKRYLDITYNIKISTSTIGTIIRRYEIASKYENKTIMIEEIKENGGVLICIDAIHPYNGADVLIVARDFFTGRIIYVKNVKTQKTDVHKAFQEKLKKIMEENKITVLGIMSDDHKSQRIAIKEVWGADIPHCSCLFHFKKQVMTKPLELHSKLIKAIRKALRRITWVENFRRGELNLDEERPISRYLMKLIKDLFILTKWKVGRNNFSLDAIKYYERIFYFHGELLKLKNKIDENHMPLNRQELIIISRILLNLKNILNENRQKYLELTSIFAQIHVIKEILDDHDEKGEAGLDTLKEIVEVLKEQLKMEKNLGKYEEHFIKEFIDFISDRGQTLFNYRRVNENYIKNDKKIQEKIRNAKNKEEKDEIKNKLYAPRTNNDLESMFKELRYILKRILGQHNANRYLLAHGEYILYVEIDAPLEKIKEILMNADYSAISEEIKKNIKPRLTRFIRIKDDEKFESIKREYAEMRAEILAIYK